MGVGSPCDISLAAVVVTPFYSPTMVMTVIVSKITQFLHFLNAMPLTKIQKISSIHLLACSVMSLVTVA